MGEFGSQWRSGGGNRELLLVMSGKGYTLVEIIMVVSLVGILAVVAFPYFSDLSDDAKEAVTRDEMKALKRAIVGDGKAVIHGHFVFAGYEADVGALPSSLTDLAINPSTGDTTQTYNPITRSGWRGPYIDTSSDSDYSSDAWGTAYVYSSASRYIRSWGPNQTNNGGGGDDIDLSF